ncbi:hypothetical protein D9M72_541040 [compost metagenome]
MGRRAEAFEPRLPLHRRAGNRRCRTAGRPRRSRHPAHHSDRHDPDDRRRRQARNRLDPRPDRLCAALQHPRRHHQGSEGAQGAHPRRRSRHHHPVDPRRPGGPDRQLPRQALLRLRPGDEAAALRSRTGQGPSEGSRCCAGRLRADRRSRQRCDLQRGRTGDCQLPATDRHQRDDQAL